MDRKNKGKELFNKFSDAVRVLLVDDDKSCHLELARMLQECGFDVTKCNGAKDALNWLRKDTSRFDIMITERNLPDMELLQKVEQEMNLLVIVMSRDRGITIHGVLKDITMNFLITLWPYVFGKDIRNPAEVQQPTNDVNEAKRRRFNWSPDLHNIFTDCMEELKKEVIKPTPKKLMERMKAKDVKGLTTAIVKSHNQKYEKRLKKDGPSSVHVLESLNSATQLPRAPAAMNKSSHHIGAPQAMTQPSSSRQIRNDLPGGQAFDDGTSMNASTNSLDNNPQNQDFVELVFDLPDDPNFNCSDFSKDTFPDINFEEFNFEEIGDYLSNKSR